MSVYCVSGCSEDEFNTSSRCLGCSDCEPRYGQCTGNCTYEDAFGPFCQYSCPPHYHGAECEYWCGGCEQELCDNSTGLCVTGCKDRFHGDNCNDCADGWSGTYCDTECRDSCITCERHNYNQCTVCKDATFYGERCDQRCPEHCDVSHCSISGTCLSCVDGFYGESCSSLCPALCKDRKCDMASGKCEACIAGFHGSSCDSPCNKCDSCKQNDGSCVSECQSGWYGVQCELQCPEHCVRGECHKNTGSCVSCPSNRAGDQCEEVQETDSNTGLYVGIGVLSLLVVLIIVALVIKEARKKLVRKVPESTEDVGYENVGMTNQSLTDVTKTTTVPQPRPQQRTEPVAKSAAARVQHQPKKPPKPAVSSKPSAARTQPPSAPGGEYEICEAVKPTDGAGREYDVVNVQDIDTTPKLYDQLNVPGNNHV